MKKVYITAIFLLTPILLNYCLLSWRAPGVVGNPEAWIGFFASFLGVLGAVGIATYQIKIQKERDEHTLRVNNRSYFSATQYKGTIRISKNDCRENSRVILTDAYRMLLKLTDVKDDYNDKTIYMRILHFGNPELVFNCKIAVYVEELQLDEVYVVESQIASIEKGTEVFLPLAYERKLKETSLRVHKILIEYSTVMNERMKFYANHIEGKTELYSLYDGQEELIYSNPSVPQTWLYPEDPKPIS